MPCVLFATRASVRGCSFGCLVETPFCDFKKALGREGVLVAHEKKGIQCSTLKASMQIQKIWFFACNFLTI